MIPQRTCRRVPPADPEGSQIPTTPTTSPSTVAGTTRSRRGVAATATRINDRSGARRSARELAAADRHRRPRQATEEPPQPVAPSGAARGSRGRVEPEGEPGQSETRVEQEQQEPARRARVLSCAVVAIRSRRRARRRRTDARLGPRESTKPDHTQVADDDNPRAEAPATTSSSGSPTQIVRLGPNREKGVSRPVERLGQSSGCRVVAVDKGRQQGPRARRVRRLRRQRAAAVRARSHGTDRPSRTVAPRDQHYRKIAMLHLQMTSRRTRDPGVIVASASRDQETGARKVRTPSPYSLGAGPEHERTTRSGRGQNRVRGQHTRASRWPLSGEGLDRVVVPRARAGARGGNATPVTTPVRKHPPASNGGAPRRRRRAGAGNESPSRRPSAERDASHETSPAPGARRSPASRPPGLTREWGARSASVSPDASIRGARLTEKAPFAPRRVSSARHRPDAGSVPALGGSALG